MSDIPIQKRLELVNQIRLKHSRNQSDLLDCQQILYGRKIQARSDRKDDTYFEEQQEIPVSTFRIRLVLAGILLVAFLMMEQSSLPMAETVTSKINQALSQDYQAVVETLAAKVLSDWQAR